jgi:epoxyqueuosine reductase
MSVPQPIDQPADWLTAIVRDFVSEHSHITLRDGTEENAWAEPLVGFARGDDPLFDRYKEVVGDYHWTPQDIFTQIFPQVPAAPADLTVIAWVLPQTEATKADNRAQTTYPAERWARTRIFGEEINVRLREHVVSALEERGYPAVAPMLAPGWDTRDSERYVYSSNWSERHAAYACALGTFGLCDGLITPKGKAMRVGSVVARILIPATPRPYTDHHAYCLFFSQGVCGKCITRCPAEAISPAGHDKMKCSHYLRSKTSDYVRAHYGFDGYGCGLCQTKVPCESRIPARADG